jgi:hypothetical protein
MNKSHDNTVHSTHADTPKARVIRSGHTNSPSTRYPISGGARRKAGRPNKSQQNPTPGPTGEFARRKAGRPGKTQTTQGAPLQEHTTEKVRRKAGRPVITRESPPSEPTAEIPRHAVGRPKKTRATLTQEPFPEVVRRKVGRPRNASFNDTEAEPTGYNEGHSGRVSTNNNRGHNTVISLDRTERHVQFNFSNGVVERANKPDTRTTCPRLTRSARQCIASERPVTDAGGRPRQKDTDTK